MSPGAIGISGWGRPSGLCGDDGSVCRDRLLSLWRELQAAAERWYDRSADCTFTTFHAWEYSRSPKSTKVHRNIILRNEIAPELPISSLETPVEMDLRRQLLEQCNDSGSGCDAIAIPHNPNLSNGQMFPLTRLNGKKLNKDVIEMRARYEPLYEVTQIKGDGEAHPFLSPDDEFADFIAHRLPSIIKNICSNSGAWCRKSCRFEGQ